MKKYNGIFVAGLVVLSGCQSHVGSSNPPHVSDNKVLTDSVCAAYKAGYASAKFNIQGALTKLNYAKVETCSKWYHSRHSTNSLKTITTLQGDSPYDFSNNTVVNWGQAGANSVLFVNNDSLYPGTNIPDIQYPIESYINVIESAGAYGSPVIINTLYENSIPHGYQVSNWSDTPNGLPPFFPNTNFPTNANSLINVTAYSGVIFPRVCNDDYRDNFSADVMLIMPNTTAQEDITVYYNFPVAFLNYCSWQGTTLGNYDQYSSVVQMYGGIFADQIFSQPMESCTYSTTNPNTGSSISSLVCNAGGYNFTVGMNEFFSNLSQYPDSVIDPVIQGSKCYLSGNNSLNGHTSYCTQNGWALTVTNN